ncbi:MAG: hypothetical protein ABF868_02900 [Sporolactobacillus sp.]
MSRSKQTNLSSLGVVQLTAHNPYVIAWWSAAFPGFGHMLLNMHLKGNLFFIFEIIINVHARLNEAMVASFEGHFELVRQELDPRWTMLYIPFYLFCIFDSYHSAININARCYIDRHQTLPQATFHINGFEVCSLERRSPLIASVASLFMPGLGQIYVCRHVPATALLIWTVIITYYSNDLTALQQLFDGHVDKARELINMEWLMFAPSLAFGTSYDALISAVAQNKLFIQQQDDLFRLHWPARPIIVPHTKTGDQP